MRIISQNGRLDIPYKKALISMEDTMIYVRFEDMILLVAEYSCTEEAEHVLEVMRESYVDRFAYYKFPKSMENEEDD